MSIPRAERYDHLPRDYRLLGDRPISEQGLRLASKDRADHPNAADQTCQIPRDHGPHPYGPIHPDGGLAHWCPGQPEDA